VQEGHITSYMEEMISGPATLISPEIGVRAEFEEVQIRLMDDASMPGGYVRTAPDCKALRLYRLHNEELYLVFQALENHRVPVHTTAAFLKVKGFPQIRRANAWPDESWRALHEAIISINRSVL
jgi:hypothetical protein